MTEPIDYKQLAEELYLSLKTAQSPLTLNQLNMIDKYENLHKPKMTKCAIGGACHAELVDYKNQTYALLWFRWYEVKDSNLYLIEHYSTVNALNQAYGEYKNQPKQVRL